MGGVWEDSSFSPKEHNVKKESEAETEIFFVKENKFLNASWWT